MPKTQVQKEDTLYAKNIELQENVDLDDDIMLTESDEIKKKNQITTTSASKAKRDKSPNVDDDQIANFKVLADRYDTAKASGLFEVKKSEPRHILYGKVFCCFAVLYTFIGLFFWACLSGFLSDPEGMLVANLVIFFVFTSILAAGVVYFTVFKAKEAAAKMAELQKAEEEAKAKKGQTGV